MKTGSAGLESLHVGKQRADTWLYTRKLRDAIAQNVIANARKANWDMQNQSLQVQR
jgi:hypothetical protein